MKINFYWFYFALILVLGRFSLLCALYIPVSPMGGAFVLDANRFIWHTLFAEIGFAMALSFVLMLISLIKFNYSEKVVKFVSIALAFTYFVLSAIDDEVMRWMGQKLSLSFLNTYKMAFMDKEIVTTVALDGLSHFLLEICLVIVFIIILSVFSYKFHWKSFIFKPFKIKSFLAPILIILFTILGCTSHIWFNKSVRRWARIKPVVYGLVENLMESFSLKNPPDDYREGIIALGGDPNSDYPFYKEVVNEDSVYVDFRNKPIEEKPDIILLNIESFRGWVNDMRLDINCKRMPYLCKLSQSGLYFPNTYSVGNPSIEGLIGIMLSIYSYPPSVLLNSHPNMNMISISEILSKAGYYTEVLMGSDPKFSNEEIWYKKWFDYYEFTEGVEDDVSLANRFKKLYEDRPKDKPLFLHLLTHSMHIPFELPKEYGETPVDRCDAYLRTTVHLDNALKIILDAIEKDTRGKNTLIILVGDHSYPNAKQMQYLESLGSISDGFTWIGMLFYGNGVTPYTEKRPVSQADIAPSILGYLNLNVSNHFMGVDLLSKMDSLSYLELPPVFSFKMENMTMHKDSLTYIFNPISDISDPVVEKSFVIPTWDTTSLCEGFISGIKTSISENELKENSDYMKSAYRAYKYVIHKNKLMPSK